MQLNQLYVFIIPNMKNFLVKRSILCLFPVLLFFIPLQTNAQMFSIGDPDAKQDRPLGTRTIFGAAWEAGEFIYKGEGATDLQRLDFNDSMLRLFLESPGLDISVAFGGAITGMNENSAVNLNARLYNNFYLKREQNFVFAIPVQLTTDLLQVRRNETSAEFQQSSLVFGAGAFSAMRLGSRLSLNLKATPNYGFSFSQGSLFGGGLFRFDGNTFLLIHNIFGDSALSIGYKFDYRSYRIQGNLNDYDFTSHSITLGIAF